MWSRGADRDASLVSEVERHGGSASAQPHASASVLFLSRLCTPSSELEDGTQSNQEQWTKPNVDRRIAAGAIQQVNKEKQSSRCRRVLSDREDQSKEALHEISPL
jgi:hypothetical protein